MLDIGINPIGIGVSTAVVLGFALTFDIPAGVLADKWSRKGVLVISAAALAICSILAGSSHNLGLYVISSLFYGLYVVTTSGTYQAIIYDSLHEENRSAEYSKIVGRAYALFLGGAGVANVASGFMAHAFGYRFTFFITVISCLLNIILIFSIREPAFHKAEQKERALKQLKDVASTIAKIKLLRNLTIVMSLLSITELFKSELGQLYMLRYLSTSEIIGLLWAAYAFTWSLGSLVAHRFRARLNTLIICSVVPFVIMAFVDNWFSLVLFMVQAVAAGALINQIETRIQESTPSAVRASILSVLSTLGRAIAVPASLLLGWIIQRYNAFWALRFIAVIAALMLLHWLWANRHNLESEVSSPLST
jgi:MFS family permease